MSKNNNAPACLAEEDGTKHKNSLSGQRVRLLSALAMLIPVTKEYARNELNIPALTLRMRELRNLGWPIRHWYKSPDSSTGRRVAAYTLVPGTYQIRIVVPRGSWTKEIECIGMSSDDGGANGRE